MRMEHNYNNLSKREKDKKVKFAKSNRFEYFVNEVNGKFHVAIFASSEAMAAAR